MEIFVDSVVFKPSANVFPSFLHYLPKLISERLKSMSFPVNSEFSLQLQKFSPRKFCHIRYTYQCKPTITHLNYISVNQQSQNRYIHYLKYEYIYLECWHEPQQIQKQLGRNKEVVVRNEVSSTFKPLFIKNMEWIGAYVTTE